MQGSSVSNERGFSLIELIMVMAAMVTLAAVLVPSFKTLTLSMKARDAARKVERELQTARLKAVTVSRTLRVRFNCPSAGQFRIIELTGIHGQVELANRGESEMRAQNGVYDMKAGNLHLTGGIEIGATGGYQIWLTDAFVEVRKGHIVTKNPVKAVFPDGSLQAAQLEIFDHGDRVRFDGGVTMTLLLPPADQARAGAAK